MGANSHFGAKSTTNQRAEYKIPHHLNSDDFRLPLQPSRIQRMVERYSSGLAVDNYPAINSTVALEERPGRSMPLTRPGDIGWLLTGSTQAAQGQPVREPDLVMYTVDPWRQHVLLISPDGNTGAYRVIGNGRNADRPIRRLLGW